MECEFSSRLTSALSKVQVSAQYGEDTRLAEAKLGDEAEIFLSPHSTELVAASAIRRITWGAL